MEAGQGIIDFTIKKPIVKKVLEVKTQTDSSGIYNVYVEPKFTWAKKPLPEKITDGLHGGIIFRKFSNGDKKENNMEIYVPGFGFGAGGYVAAGTGPFLIGTSSLGGLTHLCLPWIAILLLVTSILWAIRHILMQTYQRKDSQKKPGLRNWIHETIEKDLQSGNRDISLVNGSIGLALTAEDTKRSLLSQPKPIVSPVTSASLYSASDQNSLIKSKKSSTFKAASTASILSYSSTLMGSVTYEVPSWVHSQFQVRSNQVAVCKGTGMIFTVSEKKSPNSYSRENLNELTILEPSDYFECAEVMLLCRESIIIGKMKNSHYNIDIMPYVIQIWCTATGSIDRSAQGSTACICMCSIRDYYLIVLTKDHLSIRHLPDDSCVAKIPSQVPNNSTNIEMRSTEDMKYIVITTHVGPTWAIYVYNFDNLLKSGLEVSKRIVSASSVALISSSEIVMASTSTNFVMWNFIQNSESPVIQSCAQEIQCMLSSTLLQLLLIQFTKCIRVFQTDQWTPIYEIPVTCEQVCALTFSCYLDGNRYLAIALDDCTIQLHDIGSCRLIITFNIDFPVTCLEFDDDKQRLLAVSDRASHYLIKMFQLS